MTRKKKRRSSVVEIGTGPAKVKIYTINRKDGYREFVLAWKEGGRRRVRSLSCDEEARLVAQQISVRLTNGSTVGDEATKRDLDLLRHCENQAKEFGVSLAAAMDEWASARKAADGIAISDAVRFYLANRADIVRMKSLTEVASEYLASRRASGVTAAYVARSNEYLQRFTGQVKGNIADVTVAQINAFLQAQKSLGPVTRNGLRTCLVTMFGFAKRQGYLHPDRKTAAEQSESFKVPDTDIEIFTPEEILKLLLAAHARLVPLVAIGAFSGIRTAEIMRLDWEDIKWDRGHIEIAGRKAKTAARRLVPLADNLKAWLAPWRQETGQIIPMITATGALSLLGSKAGIPGGWRKNALRHSYISYRVALTGDVPRTALEAGNSPAMIFRHYRELVDLESAEQWFAVTPPEGWMPKDLPAPIRERIRKAAALRDAEIVDNSNPA
jgi:integrase